MGAVENQLAEMSREALSDLLLETARKLSEAQKEIACLEQAVKDANLHRLVNMEAIRDCVESSLGDLSTELSFKIQELCKE